jgi:type IV pilus assembly protein PilA
MKNRNSKSGFTLVEVIVVLVILAILAAIAIPALTGYIDKAKQRTMVAEAREAMMAMQTLLTLQYETEPGSPVDTAYGGAYNMAEDYVYVGYDVTTAKYKVYPCATSAGGTEQNALGYKEWTGLSDISPGFYQPVQHYWNSGPCGILDSDGRMIGFRIFIMQNDELHAVTWNVNLYDTNGSWHEEPDDSGWTYYDVNMTNDAITKH